MTAKRALLITNDVVSRPFVVFAIKVMAPGPRRLAMVKLAHHLTEARSVQGTFPGRFQIAAMERQPQVVQSAQRAA
jgi:hypothetical protein